MLLPGVACSFASYQAWVSLIRTVSFSLNQLPFSADAIALICCWWCLLKIWRWCYDFFWCLRCIPWWWSHFVVMSSGCSRYGWFPDQFCFSIMVSEFWCGLIKQYRGILWASFAIPYAFPIDLLLVNVFFYHSSNSLLKHMIIHVHLYIYNWSMLKIHLLIPGSLSPIYCLHQADYTKLLKSCTFTSTFMYCWHQEAFQCCYPSNQCYQIW